MKERIKAIRKSKNLTQAAFGEKIGVSQNFVALMENGQRAPGDRTVRDICRIFNVNDIWLRTGAGQMYDPQGREEELTESIRRMISAAPDSFKSALVSVLLRFDPDGPEWQALEKIYHSLEKEIDK